MPAFVKRFGTGNVPPDLQDKIPPVPKQKSAQRLSPQEGLTLRRTVQNDGEVTPKYAAIAAATAPIMAMVSNVAVLASAILFLYGGHGDGVWRATCPAPRMAAITRRGTRIAGACAGNAANYQTPVFNFAPTWDQFT